MNDKDNVRSVALGSDHSCFKQKETLLRFLETLGYRVDYPDIAVAVARKVVNEDCERGIIMDGAGIGSCIACNKVRGIRAANCWDLRTVINSREHNDANVLSLGGSLHGIDELCLFAKAWLQTRYEGGRHNVRVNKIIAMERGGLRD